MNCDRRSFIRTGGVSLAFTGVVPAFIQSCIRGGTDTAILENMTRDVVPLTDQDYSDRQEKVRALMAERSMDALWIEGGTNLEYFFDVGWWTSERVFGVVLPVAGDSVWICPEFEAPRAAELIRFGDDIRTWEEHASPYTLLKDVFQSMPTPVKRLAIGPDVRNFVVEGIRKETVLALMDGSGIINRCRGIKTEKELSFMELANRITKKAYQWAFAQVSTGLTPMEMRDLISAGHAAQGATGEGWPLFGPLSAFPHGSRQEYQLREGDVILVDGGCTVEGYRSDVTRTIVFGRPSDKQRKVFDMVKRAQDAAMSTARPGIPAGEVDRAARKVIEDAGYGPGYTYFVHRLGHGIGMDWHEWPYLVKDNPLPLEPGMTMSNEPGVYIYDEFGLRIEDCFVVTEDGSRYLGGMLCESLEKPFGDDDV
jgi:Xaa-Pro dipeptidase